MGARIALGEELAARPRIGVRDMLRCLVGAETETLEDSVRDARAAVHATFGTPGCSRLTTVVCHV